MKKIKYILFLIISFFPFVVNADHIYNIDMKINIDKNGTASIIENWEVEASSGSEWYKEYLNLRNIELTDFRVSMDGKNLSENKNWNIDASLGEKAYKYGINYKSNGLELCFGKTDYKRHNFTLEYKLSNMIFNTGDSQTLYFTFLPKMDVDNYSIIIDSFYEFPDTLDVWGYGAKGYAYVKDGKIMMSNEGRVSNNYVTLLVKFPPNVFETSNSYSEFVYFEDVLSRAEQGTFEYDYDEEKTSIFDVILNIIFFILLPVTMIILSVKSVIENGYGYKDNKQINKKNTPMFREIPCNKDIYYANALVKLNNFEYKESNILGAIILKWVKEDKIRFVNGETGLFNKNTSKIDMTKQFISDFNTNPNEEKLFNIMREASKDGFLETSELENWAKNNYSKFFNTLNDLSKVEIGKLKNEGHIYKRTSKKECKCKNVLDDKIYQDSSQLYGLKLFLEEFSRMDTKEVMEVKLWDEYLMFAYIFGIANRVAKQLKNLYPEIIQNMQASGNNIDYDTLIFIDSISTDSVSAATSARAAAQSYSSGGGGFSSGGGGGGSFGGGGSAGGR